MKRVAIGIVVLSLLIVSNTGFVPAKSSQKLNLPLLPAQKRGCFTRIDRMTDDLLVLDGYSGKKAFKLTDGSAVEKFVLPRESTNYTSDLIDSSTRGPAGKYPFFETDDGKRYIPGVNFGCDKKDEYGQPISRCGISSIYPDGYCIYSQTQNNYMFHTFKIFKIGGDKELWSINLYGRNWHATHFGKWLMLDESNKQTYCIYDIDTGKNVLNDNFDGRMYGYPRLLSDKYFIISGTIFDTTTWKVVHDFNIEHLGLRLVGDVLSAVFIDRSHKGFDDKQALFYCEWNLAQGTMEEQIELDVPMFNGSTNSMIYAAFNRFVYCFNCVSHCYEVVNVDTGKSVFSHKVEGFDYLSGGRGQADNGRYVVYMDYASIFCYDTQTGSLWSMKNAYLATDGGCDGTWFIDHKTINGKEVLELVNTQYSNRMVTITDQPGKIYTEPDCVLELVEDYFGTKSKIIRHELDGTVKTMETPIDQQHWLYPFLSNGSWHFIKIMGGKIYVLTTTKNEFKTVYVHDCGSQTPSYKTQDGELMYAIDRTKLIIVDLSSGKEQTFEDEKGFDWIEFAGKRFVRFDENRIGKAILDRKTGQITSYDGKTLGYIGFDNETLYFSGEKKFATFIDGKMDIKDMNYEVGGSFIKNGYITDGNTLYDTSGKIIQKLFIARDGYIPKDLKGVDFAGFGELVVSFKINPPNLQPYYPNNVVYYQNCPTYSLNRGQEGLTLENLSKKTITGTVWTADLTSNDNVIELKSEEFTCKGGSTTEICTQTMTDHCVVYVDLNALMDTSKSALENVLNNYNLTMFEGNPVESPGQKAVVVTVWGK